MSSSLDIRGLLGRFPANECGIDDHEELDLACDLACPLAAHARDRGLVRGERLVELAEGACMLLDIVLARLDECLCIGSGLRNGFGLVARGSRDVELVTRGDHPLVRELLRRVARRIVDEQELAERGELVAPADPRSLGTPIGGRETRRQALALGSAMVVACIDRRERRECALEPADRFGELVLRVDDQGVERSAARPRVRGRTAERAGLALDELGACVGVAGGLAQLLDDTSALGPQRRSGVALELGDPARVGIGAGRAGELGELALELGTCGRGTARLTGECQQAVEVGRALACFVLGAARGIERQPAALGERIGLALRLGELGLCLLVLGGGGRALATEKLAAARVLGKVAVRARDLGGERRVLAEGSIELAPAGDGVRERDAGGEPRCIARERGDGATFEDIVECRVERREVNAAGQRTRDRSRTIETLFVRMSAGAELRRGEV